LQCVAARCVCGQQRRPHLVCHLVVVVLMYQPAASPASQSNRYAHGMRAACDVCLRLTRGLRCQVRTATCVSLLSRCLKAGKGVAAGHACASYDLRLHAGTRACNRCSAHDLACPCKRTCACSDNRVSTGPCIYPIACPVLMGTT